MFAPGEAVVCVDASDLPSPPWTPLVCGKEYVIRSVEPIPEIDGNYDKNIHKKAKYGLRLWGVNNLVNPAFGKEFCYADSRFEKIQPNTDILYMPEKIKRNITNKIAA
jgi:hypothetical protein